MTAPEDRETERIYDRMLAMKMVSFDAFVILVSTEWANTTVDKAICDFFGKLRTRASYDELKGVAVSIGKRTESIVIKGSEYYTAAAAALNRCMNGET